MEYRLLGECVETVIDHRGLTPKKLQGDWSQVGYRAISAKNIKNGMLVNEGSMKRVDSVLYKRWMTEEIERGSIFITSEAPFGEVLYWDSDEKLVLSQRVFGLKARSSICDARYLYYWMRCPYFQRELMGRSTGTTVTGLRQPELLKCAVAVPDLEVQKKMACALSIIDRKIALNNRLNDYLVDLATVLFEKALDEETCLIPFGELAELEDSKRIPLNKQDREKRKGPYPYYGATSIMDYVDDYLFEGIRVLLGEDGSVMTDEGHPFLQYVWGKYWVNNHAHIIKAKSDYSLEALYLALRRTVINHIVTGAVQMKISQKNLNGLELQMPNLTTIPDFGPFFTMCRHNADEAKRLAKLRDILLPKMMSGEIDASKISIDWKEDFE